MNEPRVVTTEADFRAAWEGRSDGRDDRGPARAVRIPVEVRLEVDDPFRAYRRARDGPGGVFLETTGGQSGWGYFGVEPVERVTVSPEAAVWEETDTTSMTEAEEPSGAALSTPERSSPTLAALEGRLEATTLQRGNCSVPYPSGAIGWLSYDIARELESLPETTVDDRELPHLEVGIFDCLAAWQCPTDEGPVTLHITACPVLEEDDGSLSSAELRDAYARGRAKARSLATAIQAGDETVGDPPVDSADAAFESTCDRAAFADRVRQVKSYIRDGDTFQANISQRLVAPAAVHPVDAYAALRTVNPAPYSCLLEGRSVDLVSASPELLLERDGSVLYTEPIAGTRPRGDTPDADEAFATELLDDEKERAEHAMLVDLERNDMGKVCAYGSVDVTEYRRIDRYSAVMHLVSLVTGELRPEVSLAETVAAIFPGGTITGAPKPRTMEIIDELEDTRRGPYTGGVGLFGFDGRATINIIIRTLVRHEDEYHLRVGAGIVHDSDPEREYDETLSKAQALLEAMDAALGEQTRVGLETELEVSGDD